MENKRIKLSNDENNNSSTDLKLDIKEYINRITKIIHENLPKHQISTTNLNYNEENLTHDNDKIEFKYHHPPKEISLFFENFKFEDKIYIYIELPDEIFNEEDYNEYKWHYKKILYLMYICQIISNNYQIIQYGIYCSNIYAEINDSELNNLKICLLPLLSQKSFKLKESIKENEDIKLLLRDMYMKSYIIKTSEILEKDEMKNTIEAISLFQKWCKCHHMDTIDGYVDFYYYILISKFIQKNLINIHLNPYPIFKMIMMVISSKTYPESIYNENLISSADVFIMDPVMSCSKLWLNCLKEKAKIFCNSFRLDMNINTYFRSIHFLNKYSLLNEYDQIIRIKLNQNNFKNSNSNPNYLKILFEKMEKVIKMALTDRYEIFHIKIPNVKIKEKTIDLDLDLDLDLIEIKDIYLCISLNKLSRIQDKGPFGSEKKASLEYRRFWGDEKSTLRRFENGEIRETVTWSQDPSHKFQITEQILEYIIKRHFNSEVVLYESLTDKILKSKSNVNETWNEIDVVIEKLKEKLRPLKNTALKIINVESVSNVTRRSMYYHQMKTKNKRLITHYYHNEPIEIILELESSNKWPNEEDEIQRIKKLLIQQIGIEIKKQLKISNIKISKTYLDIIYNKYRFRMFLACPKIGTGLNNRDVGYEKKNFHYNVKMIQSRNPSMSNAILMARKWLSKNMFDPHITPDLIDLLFIFIYEGDLTKHSPKTPLAGFVRFLVLINEYLFENEVLIVDPESLLTNDDIKITENWYLRRKDVKISNKAPDSMCMCIMTPLDKKSSITQEKPVRPILNRMRYYAKNALNVIKFIINSEDGIKQNIKTILIPKMIDFDILIHLKKSISIDKGADIKMALISKIKEKYDEICICCYDKVEGDKIGIHWKPRSFLPEKLLSHEKSKIKSHMISLLDNNYEIPNIISILNDIENFEISSDVLDYIELIKI